MALAIGFALAAGCNAADDRSWCGGSGAGSSLFPAETIKDWKSYADHLAIVTIVSVRRPDRGLPVSTLRVDRVLWSAAAAPGLARRLKMRRLSGDEVGESFLSPMLFVEFAGEWWPLDGCAPVRVDEDGRVAEDGRGGPLLAGQTAIEVADRLRRARPDPVAYRYRHLRPAERVEAVARRR